MGRPSYVSEAGKEHLHDQGDSRALQGRMFTKKTFEISLHARAKAEARERDENVAAIAEPSKSTVKKYYRELLPVAVKTPGHQNLRRLIVSIK